MVMKQNNKRIIALMGTLFLPAIWLGLKYIVGVSDRFLPTPYAVISAFGDIEPSIWLHALYTLTRLIVGLFGGVLAGIGLGILMARFEAVDAFLTPPVQAVRSVPAVAIVPFFILWFGFSEFGRVLLVVSGIAFNITIATDQILKEVPEKYRILFRSFKIPPSQLILDYMIPRIQENLLPTIRFAMSTAIGVVIVSELLGSQIGLGYLMQTARSTFSMHVIFLTTIILGIMNAICDTLLAVSWQKMVYWRKV